MKRRTSLVKAAFQGDLWPLRLRLSCKRTWITKEKLSASVPCKMQFLVVPTMIRFPLPMVTTRTPPSISGNLREKEGVKMKQEISLSKFVYLCLTTGRIEFLVPFDDPSVLATAGEISAIFQGADRKDTRLVGIENRP